MRIPTIILLIFLMANSGFYFSSMAGEVLLEPSDGSSVFIRDFEVGKSISTQQIRTCQVQAQDYGDEIKPKNPDQNCSSGFLARAMPQAVRWSEEGDLFVFGYSNILFMRKKITSDFGQIKFNESLVTGKYSQLKKIHAISLDPKNEEIAVLEGESHRILILTTQFGGNLAPFRSIKLEELQGAVSLAIDPVNDEIAFANPLLGKIYFLSRLADEEGRKSENRLNLRRFLGGPKTQIEMPSAIAFDSQRAELWVADSGANQILVFEAKAQGDVAPKRVIRGLSSRLKSPISLAFSKKLDQIQVINENRELLIFDALAEGNVHPIKAFPFLNSH